VKGMDGWGGTNGIGPPVVTSGHASATLRVLASRMDDWRCLPAEGPSSGSEAATPGVTSFNGSPG